MRLPADVEIVPAAKGFDAGLLLEVIAGLRRCPRGGLLAITSPREDVAADLERWSRFTGNAIVARTSETDGTRFVVRNGPAPAEEPPRAIGSRLWLYTNFDCNLACDYCCVRSSPRAERRALSRERIEAIAREARDLGVEQIFLTGGEPFLVPDLAAIVSACAAAAPTTILTNGMLFGGARREILASFPRDRVTLQISLDSASPELHDLHRGRGSFRRAWEGVLVARELGFRVRLAATVSSDVDDASFRAFLDRESVAEEDRVIRRIALRGAAESGVALARADLVPEITVTARGVYWHPVGADDDDFFVCADPTPLAAAIDAVRVAYAGERAHADTLAQIFHCA